jgi:hypothetical protein
MATSADYDTLNDILGAVDFTEEARVMDGNRLLEERYSSATIGKRVVIIHQYQGNKCCGFDIAIEDV